MQSQDGQGGQAPDSPPSEPSLHNSRGDTRDQPQHGAPSQLSGEPGLPDRKVFRLPGALVAWWAWVVVAVAGLVDLAVSGRDHTSVVIAVILVLVTGVAYACALRPLVIADRDGITVRNPLRDHRIPWGAVTGVDMKESVQVHCAEPGAPREKIIYSWALYTQRRSRIRAEIMEQRSRTRQPQQGYATANRMPAEAQRLVRQPTAHIMATQLDELARSARDRGAAAGSRISTWAWQPIAAILVPAIALALVITLG
jgi:Bacterial PH domain